MASAFIPPGGVRVFPNRRVPCLLYTSISTVFFPNISRLIQEKAYKHVSNVIQQVMTSTLCICIPLFTIMMVLSDRIIKVLFFRGAFDINAVNMTVVVLKIYLCAIIPMNLRILLEKVYYSMQDTKKPLIFSIISIIINIILSVVLIKPLGFMGLAIGTSISVWVSIFFYLSGFKTSKLRKIVVISKEIGKYCLSAFFMGIVCFFVNRNIFSTNQNTTMKELIGIVIIIVLGGFVYSTCLVILKTNIIQKFVGHIRG